MWLTAGPGQAGWGPPLVALALDYFSVCKLRCSPSWDTSLRGVAGARRWALSLPSSSKPRTWWSGVRGAGPESRGPGWNGLPIGTCFQAAVSSVNCPVWCQGAENFSACSQTRLTRGFMKPLQKMVSKKAQLCLGRCWEHPHLPSTYPYPTTYPPLKLREV